jgi:transcriptional regulator with XRE-family HTH domain
MNVPNTTLQAVRKSMRLSQDEFARALQKAGLKAGRPNDAGKRLVQRWESGEIASPRPVYARALEAVTGLPIESLGFPAGVDAIVIEDGRGGHDLEVRPAGPSPAGSARQGNYSGVWLSRYEFYSSGRNEHFIYQHYVVVLQHGDRLNVRSLPGSNPSTVTLELTIDGSVATGTWVEQTESEGYYRGARYYGAIQLLLEPSGRRLAGKWVGFGSSMDVNTGPWSFTFVDGSTSKVTLDRYNRPPND